MPLEKRKLCEGSYVNQLKSFEHDPFLQVTPDHECATCLHPGFKKFTCSQLHGSSMVYDSQRRFSHKPTGLNTFRAYNPHTHKTFMSHKKDKKHSKDKKKLVSHGDSASLGAILSRSTASGSQIVLSSECSDDSGEDQGLHTQKPYTTPYDTNLYRRNGIYKYHSAQDEEEEKEDDEEEENELEEEEEEDENEVEEEENELEEEENELEEEENELEEEENELEEEENELEEEENELEEEEEEEDELEKTFQSSYENNSLLQEHKGVHDLNYKSRSQKNSVWYDAGESEKETHDTMGTWDTSTQAFHTLPNR
jgi:flagellar biosynthesis GTPase FlhF